MGKKHLTPLLDELKKGKWPSFVTEIERAAEKSEMTEDLLGQVEQSYNEKAVHWKHGGMVGVKGYGSGIVGRFSDLPEKYPGVKEFHTVRINQPSGFFYTSDILRKIVDIGEKHASSLFNFHGSTGDIQLLGAKTSELETIFQQFTSLGFDLGGSGSALRTPSCCVGMARCEFANYDAMHACNSITQAFQDEMHRPIFNYKFKFKFSACGNDCTASIARADMSVIGTWKDDIRIDHDIVKEYAKKINLHKYVTSKCPTKCMSYGEEGLKIDNSNCSKCMHCINVMPKALRPGIKGGATILLGSKAPMVSGPRLSMVLIPFYDIVEDAKNDYQWFKDLVGKIWEFWDEYGVNRERIGELIQRVGIGNFIEAIGLEPLPEMVASPRGNPFVLYEEYMEADGGQDESSK